MQKKVEWKPGNLSLNPIRVEGNRIGIGNYGDDDDDYITWEYIKIKKKPLTKNKINENFKNGIKKYGVIVDTGNRKVIITKDGAVFYYVDMQNQSDEILKLLITKNGLVIKCVHEQTEELCKIAVELDGMMLKHVINQTEEICKIAVSKHGMAIIYVENQTDEICKLAVRQNGNAIRYVKDPTE